MLLRVVAFHEPPQGCRPAFLCWARRRGLSRGFGLEPGSATCPCDCLVCAHGRFRARREMEKNTHRHTYAHGACCVAGSGTIFLVHSIALLTCAKPVSHVCHMSGQCACGRNTVAEIPHVIKPGHVLHRTPCMFIANAACDMFGAQIRSEPTLIGDLHRGLDDRNLRCRHRFHSLLETRTSAS